ncbi:MAG: DUF1501 domain-containing protein [Planctomycetota bacterium]
MKHDELGGPTHGRRGPTRRQFVVAGIAVTAFSPVAAAFSASSFGRHAPDGRVLVVVQLTGGNDGLDTVLPLAQDAWFRARPNLSRSATGAHDVGDGLALHPSLGRSAEALRDGLLTCVHSVGYPDPDRSHFRSMDIWHTGDPAARDGAARSSGWLARMAERAARRGASGPVALYVGDGSLPRSLVGDEGPAPSIEDLERLRVPGGDATRRALELTYSDDAAGELGFLRRTGREAVALSRRLESASLRGASADWPQDRFAQHLALVSQLVRSGLGARIYQVELGGFDTHRDQPVQHAALLARLDGALAAFRRELAAAGRDRDVVTLVFSEFGRRVRENASLGTDHGAAGPVFLLGPSTRGGFVGEVPDLTDLVDGDLPHRVDFRSIYAAIERDWLGLEGELAAEPAPVLARDLARAPR